MCADHEDLFCLPGSAPRQEGEDIHEEPFLWASLPIESAIAAGVDRLYGRGAIQILLQITQPTWLWMIGFGENLFGQNGTDPCSWESFRLGRESVVGAGFSSEAAACLIGGEHWSCGGEIAESALLAREAHLVCMTDGSLVVCGCATEKENNGVGRFDSSVVVDTLCYVYDSVADKHNWSANVSGWCVKDGEIVCPKLLDERVTRCRNVEQWVRCDGQRR